jgi:hypothetical protein
VGAGREAGPLFLLGPAGAAILGQLLRADLLPEARIAPPAIWQLRALLRHRVALVRLRARLRNRIHAIVAGDGYGRPAGGYRPARAGPGSPRWSCLRSPASWPRTTWG